MVTRNESPVNIDRDVLDLARNVKREADAVQELNLTLRRQQMHSSGKKHVPSASVDRLTDEGSREVKQLKKKIKELEAKVEQYEEDIMNMSANLQKRVRKVKEP